MAATSTESIIEVQNHSAEISLPHYVIWKEDSNNDSVLRRRAARVTFPLSDEDKYHLDLLERKFDQEEGCAGLAASQIGIPKRFIIFAIRNSPNVIKWRRDFDLSQIMLKTIWLNPSYMPLTEEKHEDFEGCYSVADVVGPVERFKSIKYEAYDISGALITGIAKGFLARVIQHEIDHLDGKLFIDFVDKDRLLNKEEYIKKYRQPANEEAK
ncbi:MAG: peptide deformylase [Janthinobacterium lividum]